MTDMLDVITQPQNIVDDMDTCDKLEDRTVRNIADADCVIRVEDTLFRVSDAAFCQVFSYLRPSNIDVDFDADLDVCRMHAKVRY